MKPNKHSHHHGNGHGRHTIEESPIQLDYESTENTVGCLNEILASYHVYYMNLRGFHWNVKGHRFFALHEKFEEMYNQAALAIDEVAERILMLGFTPVHSLTEFLDMSRIKEVRNVFNDDEAVSITVENLQRLIRGIRGTLRNAAEHDEGTVDMLTGHLKFFEKMTWMMSAWLGNETRR